MKTLREGIIQPIDKAWWYGRSARCGDCGCVVELEEKDGKPGAHPQVNYTNSVAWVTCPTCGGTCGVSLKESRFHAAAGVERR